MQVRNLLVTGIHTGLFINVSNLFVNTSKNTKKKNDDFFQKFQKSKNSLILLTFISVCNDQKMIVDQFFCSLPRIG